MDTVAINRAPVLTLWAAVVAERLGFDRDAALTLGKSVAGLTARSKGQRLGIFTPSPEAVRRKPAEQARVVGVFHVALLGRAVPVLHTDEGPRATGKDQEPVNPDSVEKYLASKFGQALPPVRLAMEKLATSREPEALAEEGFRLYEAFRPGVPSGVEQETRCSGRGASRSSRERRCDHERRSRGELHSSCTSRVSAGKSSFRAQRAAMEKQAFTCARVARMY